jgi:predicted transcriptional regulator
MKSCAIMKNREHVDIVKAILEATRSGATKTQIMYKAFLSYTLLMNYLKILQDKELLKFDIRTQQYKSTKKGIQFIEYYQKLAEILDINNVETTNLFKT